jgi:methionyl-tRNA synthetase
MTLAQAHLGEPVKVEWRPLPKEFTEAMESFEINKAVEYIWSRISALDQKITETAPFKVIKEDAEKGKRMITELVAELAFIDQMLEPVLPATSGKIIEAVMANKKPENIFPRKD